MRRKIKRALQRFKHITLGVPRFAVRPSDCFLVSYPRSGNTWMRYLLARALRPEVDWELPDFEQFMPMIDRHDLAAVLPNLEGQAYRIFKSHDPFVPYYLKGRVVYIVRDGRDVMVSFHHYANSLAAKPVELGEFVRQRIAGCGRLPSWSRYVSGWLAHADHPNLLIVKYEDMLRDTAEALARVLEHYQLPTPRAQIQEAVAWATVDRVNRGFRLSAEARRKQFDGGLGGGSGKGRQRMDDATMRLFMADAEPVLCRLGYATPADGAAGAAAERGASPAAKQGI